MVRVASVVFSHYPGDPRPRREAEALVEAGMSVDILCLRGDGERREEVVNGVRVFRLPAMQTRSGKIRYLWEYGWFVLLAFLRLSRLHLFEAYQVVHIHNMPDVLVFCALLPRLGGAKIILDLHDPMPEVYMAKYSVSASHSAIRLLRLLEKWSVSFAHIVLTPNSGFRDLFLSRGCPAQKMHIVMNSPQEKIFHGETEELRRKGWGNSDKFVIMYHGLISERNGLDTALEAIAQVQREIPDLAFWVYGGGDGVKHFLERREDLNLADVVEYYGYVSQEKIASLIPSIHVGIVPNKVNPFTNLNMPTRIFEYLSMGKPVIVPRTRGILDYFDEDSVHFFEAGNPRSLAERIVDVSRNSVQSREKLSRGMEVYRAYRWELQGKHFVEVVGSLAGMDLPAEASAQAGGWRCTEYESGHEQSEDSPSCQN